MGRQAALVSAATMLSRVLGLVREQIFYSLFGASAGIHADAYQTAFRIPNLLRDLFAEGALSAAFVPTFTKTLRSDGVAAAVRLANVVLGAILVVVGGLTLAGVLAAPQVVDLLANDFRATPGKHELAVELARIMMPFLPLVSLAAVAMGQLNAHERYAPPALAAASFNVVAIVAGLGLRFAGVDEHTAVVGWSAATVLGGIVQFAVQIPALRATGFRFRPRMDFRDPGLRRIALLMGPATIGVAATQINIVVNSNFADGVQGGQSWLAASFRLMQLPIGVFGVAVATIATTRFAQGAAERDFAGMRDTLARGLRLVAFLTLPCTFGLIVLARPIVRLLYEHGQFHAGDTEAVALCTLMYALGLYTYSAVKVAAPAFYALGKPRVPLLASLVAVLGNVVLNILLFPVLGVWGLALGTSVAAVLNVTVLLVAFRSLAGPLGGAGLLGHAGRVGLASAGCAAVAFAVVTPLESALGTAATTARLVGTLGGIAAGALVYGILCRLLRVEELDQVAAKVLGRLRRGKS
jgi:putative peptidoglycan lipid II flippase